MRRECGGALHSARGWISYAWGWVCRDPGLSEVKRGCEPAYEYRIYRPDSTWLEQT